MESNRLDKTDNDWDRYAKYVLEALRDAKRGRQELRKDLSELKISLARLETKVFIRAGTTGAIAGAALSIVIAIIVSLLVSGS
jgi:hypothetical protein